MKKQFVQQKVVCYRFSDTATDEPPQNCYAARLMEKVNGGGRLNREEKTTLPAPLKTTAFHGVAFPLWVGCLIFRPY